MELDTCILDSDSCDVLKTSSELEQTKWQSNVCNIVPTIDIKGSRLSSLLNELDGILNCSLQSPEETDVGYDYIYLISPPAALNTKSCDENSLELPHCPFSEKYRCKEVWYSTQISTEDMPQWCGNVKHFLSNMKLSTFRVRCY